MKKTFKLLLCMTALVSLNACSKLLDEPSWVSEAGRVEVHEEGFTDTFDTSSLDAGTLHAIGVNYYRYGNGPMDVAVSYDPKSKTNTAARAKGEASRIQDALVRNGVRDLRMTTTAAEGTGEKSSTLVSFPALTAKPPEGCTTMPGYADAHTVLPGTAEGENKGYGIGCTVETLIAKQVSRPGDMLGRPGFETNTDARRQEAVIWQRGYYGPKSYDPLKGQNASGESTQ